MWEAAERWARELAKRAGAGNEVPVATVIACAALVVLVVGWAAWRWWPRGGTEPVTLSQETPVDSQRERAEQSTETSTAPMCVVHVVGAVRRPGVYRLGAGSRVCDAVDAAGGLLGDAVVEGLNLARILADGEQVLVPNADDVASLPPPAAQAPAGASSAQGGAGVDINSADAALLDTLPGIGPSTAEKIIAEREANGPFASIEDLGRVSGIGPKKIEALKDVAYVR